MKVVFIGESSVGKTCLISKLSGGNFLENSISSSAPMEFFHTVKVIDGKEILVTVWDTAGQEKFRAVNKIYYKEAKIAFIVYDATSKKTFDSAKEYWISSVKDILGNKAGNKEDLIDEIEIEKEDGMDLAKEHNFPFYSTSAKMNVGIFEALDESIRQYINEYGIESLMKDSLRDKIKKENKGGNNNKESKCC